MKTPLWNNTDSQDFLKFRHNFIKFGTKDVKFDEHKSTHLKKRKYKTNKNLTKCC